MSSQLMIPNFTSGSKGIDFSKVNFSNRKLLVTNPNHNSDNVGSVTLNTGSTLYLYYYITMKPYYSDWGLVGNTVARNCTNCSVTANNRSIWRSVSFNGSNVTIGTPFAGETTHWESTILYQIFGIVGTEL